MSSARMRTAAALLAGMHERDRRWMLARLSPSRSRALEALVAELRTVCPVGLDLETEALSEPPLPDDRPEAPPPGVLLAGLEGLSPAWTARALKSCAPDHAELFRAHVEEVVADRVCTDLRALPATMPPALARMLAATVRDRGRRHATATAEGAYRCDA